MKVRDVILNWPAKRWIPDETNQPQMLPAEPRELRLQWFSTPDREGWFRMTATDREERDWSAYCRIGDLAKWPVLEMTLSAQLHASLAELDGLELHSGSS